MTPTSAMTASAPVRSEEVPRNRRMAAPDATETFTTTSEHAEASEEQDTRPGELHVAGGLFQSLAEGARGRAVEQRLGGAVDGARRAWTRRQVPAGACWS